MKTGAFGEILWDVYPSEKHLGGAPLNFAAHLARHGEDVHLISAVGNDRLGVEAIAQTAKWGVGTDTVFVHDGLPTGRCNVTLDERGVPRYDLLCDVAYDRIPCPFDAELDVIYFGTLSLRCKYNRLSLSSLLEKRKYREVFVDVNLRPPFYSVSSVGMALENATVLKVSDEEASALCELMGIGEYDTPDCLAKRLYNSKPQLRCIIVTMGSKGAYAFSPPSGEEVFVPSEKVETVSTVGAGDSFSAAFLHRYMHSEGLKASLEYASKVAGLVVSRYAAVPDYLPEEIF